MDRESLKKWIKVHEGYDNMPYICTAGKLTIGYGRNLQDNGISHEEAEFMLDNDIKRVEKELLVYSWYKNSPSPVKDALMNMCFNMGLPRLLGFKRMIGYIDKRNFTMAAIEALDSRWAQQVGQRAKDVALMIREAK